MNQMASCSKEELNIRESFKKDYKLSCPVMEDDYIFKKSLTIGGLEQEWNDYLDMSKRIPELEEYRRQIRNQILSSISHVKGFDELKPINYKPKFQELRNYLEPVNCNKFLVSVDLRKGNYQAFKQLAPKYVLDTQNYEELIRRFTKEESLVRSKFFRQMIFGQLKPDVQSSVQRKMIEETIEKIFSALGQNKQIVHLSNDEVIFSLEDSKQLELIKQDITSLPYQLRVTPFRLQQIPNFFNEPWFVRTNLDPITLQEQNKKIMGVHVKYLFQVANFLNKEETVEKDLWWSERGRLHALLTREVFEFPTSPPTPTPTPSQPQPSE